MALRTLLGRLKLPAPRRVAAHRGEQPLVRLGQLYRFPVGRGVDSKHRIQVKGKD